jgi:cysteine desulfurase
MGVAPDRARGAVRLSVGAATTSEEIDAFLQALAKTAGRLRQLTAMVV